MKRQLISKILCLSCIALFCLWIWYPQIKAEAFLFNDCVCPNPKNITYSVAASVGPFSSDIAPNTEVWQKHCPQLGISSLAYNAFIRFTGDLSVSNGAYAVCYHDATYHTITLYNEYTQASAANRAEIIVHEVGHALGLAHCQSDKNSVSVMRATGFNNKAYPLEDDIAGIKVLYGQ